MSIRRFSLLLFASSFFCLTVASGATRESTGPTLAEIHEQQTELHADAVAGKGQFKDMSNEDRADVVKRQGEVLALIEGKSSLDDLNDIEKVRAFNLLESIKATLVKNEDERVICERHKPAGSNMTQRVCATVAERRRMQEVTSEALTKRPLCNGIERCKYD